MLALLTSPRFFPGAIVALQGLASARYAFEGRLFMCLYWGFATGLNAVVTWGLK